MTQPPRVVFVLAATDIGTMINSRLDYVKVEGGAVGVGLGLLNSGNYAPTETQLISELLVERRKSHGDGVLILDIGANIGCCTIPWANLMHGWGEVIAFEPQERVFYALAGNIAINNCFNAQAVWAAVGAEAGHICVPILDYQQPVNSGGLSLKPGPHNKPGQPVIFDEGYSVLCMCIDDMAWPRVDAIKIDVEGMEPEVLAGARETIARCSPIIFAEHAICGFDVLRAALPDDYRTLQAGMDTLAMPEGDPLWERIKII